MAQVEVVSVSLGLTTVAYAVGNGRAYGRASSPAPVASGLGRSFVASPTSDARASCSSVRMRSVARLAMATSTVGRTSLAVDASLGLGPG